MSIPAALASVAAKQVFDEGNDSLGLSSDPCLPSKTERKLELACDRVGFIVFRRKPDIAEMSPSWPGVWLPKSRGFDGSL